MIDKSIERTIKLPRVRIFDCKRLIFRLGKEPEWRDIDLDPDLFPIYPLPLLSRNSYLFCCGNEIKIYPKMTINDLVRVICQILGKSWDDRSYLHTIIFSTSGEIKILTELI